MLSYNITAYKLIKAEYFALDLGKVENPLFVWHKSSSYLTNLVITFTLNIYLLFYNSWWPVWVVDDNTKMKISGIIILLITSCL